VLDRQDAPVILAGHSYGGQAITALGTEARKVAGLTCLAAFGPGEGEPIGALLSTRPPTPALGHLDIDSHGFAWLPEDAHARTLRFFGQSRRAGRMRHAPLRAPIRRTVMPKAYALLSTYPPTQCGLATFSAALFANLCGPGDHASVVRVLDEPVPEGSAPQAPPEVVHDLLNGSAQSAAAAVDVINGFDVVIVQHEYGIYGGPDGRDIVPLLYALRVPSSCGSLLHSGTIVLPYGCSDSSVRIATVDLAQLMAELST
jgi:pimeloyl-ACP methyl ester carboxylesterase